MSGEVIRHRTPADGDLTIAKAVGGRSWGLKPDEVSRVRPTLRSILSVPVFSPKNPDGPLLATPQIDSDATVAAMKFDVLERRELAGRFADVVSLPIEEVEDE